MSIPVRALVAAFGAMFYFAILLDGLYIFFIRVFYYLGVWIITYPVTVYVGSANFTYWNRNGDCFFAARHRFFAPFWVNAWTLAFFYATLWLTSVVAATFVAACSAAAVATVGEGRGYTEQGGEAQNGYF